MKEAVPVYVKIPSEYQIALDAACVWVSENVTHFHCGSGMLRSEILQRVNIVDRSSQSSVLWVEPQVGQWEKTLSSFSQELPFGSNIAVVLSLPLAKRLPERKNWKDHPIGFQRYGLKNLCFTLASHSFSLEGIYALHTGNSILLNQLAAIIRSMKFYALADRLEFVAKKHYIRTWKGAGIATCALILATKA